MLIGIGIGIALGAIGMFFVAANNQKGIKQARDTALADAARVKTLAAAKGIAL